jgi:alanyl-tRNA synthetase
MEFGTKYPDIVSVYFVEEKDGSHFSKEFCGGPHVSNTSEIGQFKILKEEASSQGIRRIKAELK